MEGSDPGHSASQCEFKCKFVPAKPVDSPSLTTRGRWSGAGWALRVPLSECPSENGPGVSTVEGGTVHKMEKVRMFLSGYKCMCVHACAYL